MTCAGIWYGVLAPRGSSSARASNLLHAGSDRFVTLLSQLLMQLAVRDSCEMCVRHGVRGICAFTLYCLLRSIHGTIAEAPGATSTLCTCAALHGPTTTHVTQSR